MFQISKLKQKTKKIRFAYFFFSKRLYDKNNRNGEKKVACQLISKAETKSEQNWSSFDLLL